MLPSFLKKSQSMPPGMDAGIANRALHLSMDWGEDFCQPTQPRMAKLYPQLSAAELDAYDALARSVTSFANSYLYANANTASQEFATLLQREFDWVSRQNISRMYGQGTYFSMK